MFSKTKEKISRKKEIELFRKVKQKLEKEKDNISDEELLADILTNNQEPRNGVLYTHDGQPISNNSQEFKNLKNSNVDKFKKNN